MWLGFKSNNQIVNFTIKSQSNLSLNQLNHCKLSLSKLFATIRHNDRRLWSWSILMTVQMKYNSVQLYSRARTCMNHVSNDGVIHFRWCWCYIYIGWYMLLWKLLELFTLLYHIRSQQTIFLTVLIINEYGNSMNVRGSGNNINILRHFEFFVRFCSIISDNFN